MISDTELDARIRQGASAGESSDASACLDTPEMDLGRLMDLRTGADDPAAWDHLARCAFCRAMLREATEPVNELLVARLNRQWTVSAAARPAVAAPRRRFAAIGAGLLAAAAVAIVVFQSHVPGGERTLPEYSLDGPHGGLADVRADGPESHAFLPDSTVELVLRPRAARAARETAPVAAVFRQGPDGNLVRIGEGATHESVGRQPGGVTIDVLQNGTVVLRGPGRALLGDVPGPKVLIVALAADAGRLDALSGQHVSVASPPADVRLFAVEAELKAGP